MDGHSRLLPQRHRLHRRDVQKRRQADICQGSCVEGPFRSIQLQPRRKCQARHRHSRNQQDQRDSLEGTHSRRSGPQSQTQKQAEAPASKQQTSRLAAICDAEESLVLPSEGGAPWSLLVSVNVGLPADIEWQGKVVHTAVWKRPVAGRVMARRLNLDGDGQGDLAGHGGEHRAVMVYQLDSYRYWRPTSSVTT